MKKFFPVLLSCICAIGVLAGCNSNDDTKKDDTVIDDNTTGMNGTDTGTGTTADDKGTGTNGTMNLRGFLDEAVNVEPFDKENTLDLTKEENAKELGIKSDDIEEGYIERTSDKARADEIIVIKAKEGKAETIKKALEKHGEERHKTFTDDMKDLMDISDKREVLTNGDYVVMITSPKVTDIKDMFEKAFDTK